MTYAYAIGLQHPLAGNPNRSRLVSPTTVISKHGGLTAGFCSNLLRLTAISRLQDNWNGYGASAIDNIVIERVRNLLHYVPQELFMAPTARNSIQIEYENINGDYLEVELFVEEVAIYCIKRGCEHSCTYTYSDDDFQKIIKEVEDFCG